LDLGAYRRFLAQVLDELGVGRAVFCGHSLGGRLLAEVTAAEPDRAIALLLVDAAVGQAWGRSRRLRLLEPGPPRRRRRHLGPPTRSRRCS